MRRGGKDGHVDADLGDDLLRADTPYPGYLVELLDLVGERGDGLLDARGQLVDLSIQRIDRGQHHPTNLCAVIVEVTGQRFLQHRDLAAHRPARQLRENLRITLPTDQRIEHRPTGHPPWMLAITELSLICESSRTFPSRCLLRVRFRVSARR